MRYNKKFIRARFGIAMDALGVPHGEDFSKFEIANIGMHFIDHAPIYGGYRINRMVSETGGESMPFGSSRYSAREFVALLDGIICAAYIIAAKATADEPFKLALEPDWYAMNESQAREK